MTDLLETTDIIYEDSVATGLPTESHSSEVQRCGEYICPSQDMVSLHPGFHVAAVLLFGVYGLSANSLIIYMYSTKTKYSGGKLYILMLAILDIGSILLNLPQFIVLGHIPCCVVKWTSAYPYLAINGTYITILDAMAFERLAAVFLPFKFERNRNIIQYLTIITIIIWLGVNVLKMITEIVMFKSIYYVLRMTLIVFPGIGILCMVLVYPLITYMLFAQRRKRKIGANPPRQNPAFADVQMEPKGLNRRGSSTRLV